MRENEKLTHLQGMDRCIFLLNLNDCSKKEKKIIQDGQCKAKMLEVVSNVLVGTPVTECVSLSANGTYGVIETCGSSKG